MLIIIFFLIIILLHISGIRGLYYILPLYDKFLHFLGGIFISLVSYKIYINTKKRIPKLIEIIFIILIISILWEVHEYIWDQYLTVKYNLPQMQLSKLDTATDLIMNIFGCLIFYAFIKKKYNDK